MSTFKKANSANKQMAEDFGSEFLNKISAGFTVMGVALGSRLGLFDVMARFDEPMTSQEIADAGSFKERYVREWLGVMCTGDIIELDDSGKKYFLPMHRRSVLTGQSQLGEFSWIMPILAGVEDKLMQCFKLDGPSGISYSSYPGYQVWRERNSAKMQEWSSLGGILDRVPGLLKRLEEGIDMVDLGSGSGNVPLNIAEKFPKSNIWGVDISEEGVAMATSKATKRHLTNAHFNVQDICAMPKNWTEKWDFVCMFDVAHDVPYTTPMLKDVLRVLKPGGYFLLQDVDMHTEHKDNVGNPEAPVVYGLSLYLCMPVSLNAEGGEGWGAAWGREAAVKLLEKTGFADIKIYPGLIAVCRKAGADTPGSS